MWPGLRDPWLRSGGHRFVAGGHTGDFILSELERSGVLPILCVSRGIARLRRWSTRI